MSNFIAEAQVRVVPVIDPKALVLLKGQMSALTGTAAASGMAASSAAKAAGATAALGNASKTTTTNLLGLGSATGRLDAALLGLRTAAGSAAVIGLGAAALAAIALGKAFRQVVSLTASFETTLNVFQATTGATAQQMQSVADAAKQLGADITLPSVTATDAAEAMTELAKAGLSVQDSIDGARGVLQLATAAAISNADAVNLAASALNAFGLAGKDATRVADVFANAANLAQGSISDIGLSLQQAAAVGRQAGLSFEDTSTFLTLLARNGLRGSDAGTSLRVTLLRLIAPTKQAREEMHKLGISVLDAFGNVRVDVFQQIALAMRDMTPAARNAALSLIFGTDAIRAATILGRQSIRTLLDYREGLRQQGTAAEVAGARTKGLAGQAQALSSTLETVGLRIGQAWAPAMEGAVAGVTGLVGAVSNAEGLVSGLSTATNVATGAFAAFGSALSLVGPLVLSVANAFGNLMTAIGPATILASLAAFKAFRVVQAGLFTTAAGVGAKGLASGLETIALRALYATQALRLFGATMASAFALGGARAAAGVFAGGLVSGLSALGSALIGPTGIGIAAVAAAGGLAYLLSRETATEKASRQLKQATDALASSLQAQATAQAALRGAERGTFQTGQALDQARLARAQAAQALASSSAAPGSKERAGLLAALAIQTQSVTFAEEDFTQALKDEAKARDDLRAANQKTREDRAEELRAVTAANELARERAAYQGRFREPGVAERAYANALREANQELRKQARADITSTEEFTRNMARRKILLADFRRDLGRFATPTEIKFFIQTGSIKQLIARVSQNWKKAGYDSAQDYTAALYEALNLGAPPKIKAFIENIGHPATDLWQAAGQTAGQSYITGLTQALQAGAYNVAQAQGNMNKAIIAAGGNLSTGGQITAQQDIVEANRRAFEDLKKQLAANAKLWGYPSFREAYFAAQAALAQSLRELSDLNKQSKTEVQQAADEAARTQAENTQKFIDAFTPKTTGLERLLARAGATPGLGDDIRFNRLLLRRYIAEQKAIRDRIRNMHLHGDALKIALDAIRAINASIASTRLEITRLSMERAQQAREDRMAHLEAMLAIAETTKRKSDDKKWLEAIIAADTARIKQLQAKKKLNREEKRELDALLVDRAQRNQALRELADETNKGKTDAQKLLEAEFAFLQTQQGFTASLISNLIPGGLTGGLVGGSQPTTPAGAQIPSVGTVPGRIGTVGHQTAAVGPRPVSQGQGNTQIALLREIRNLLRKLNMGIEHPEAKNQRADASAAMDFSAGKLSMGIGL